MRRSLIAIAFAALLCSCEMPFSIKDISEPRFVVECQPIADEEGFDLMVGYADPAYGKYINGQYTFKDGDISVKVNGKELNISRQEWTRDGNYCTTRLEAKLVPGDEVEVRVKGGSLPEATGTTTVPDRPVISSYTLEEVNTSDSTTAIRARLKLDHPVADGEYYGLEIYEFTVSYYTMIDTTGLFPKVYIDSVYYTAHHTPGQVATMSDINSLDLDSFAQVLYVPGGIVNRVTEYCPMMLLTNRQFDGDSYSFYLDSSFSFFDMIEIDEDPVDYPEEYTGDDYYYDDPEEPETDNPLYPWLRTMIGSKTTYSVSLFRLSEELYNYCKAQYLINFNMLSNFGVTPPNFTYSNVYGGLGVVGGLSCTVTEAVQAPGSQEPEMPNLWDLLQMMK